MAQKKKESTGRNTRGQFTKGHKIGEATRFAKENAAACKYHEEYADQLIEYFSKPGTRVEYIKRYNRSGDVVSETPILLPNEYPTFEAFAASLKVCMDTLKNWCDQSPRFRNAYVRAKELQNAILRSNTLCGVYNPLFAKFEAVNNHGMSDKTANNSSVTVDVKYSDEIDEESD